jgi:transcriptional regulator with XRE-family HTH domain
MRARAEAIVGVRERDRRARELRVRIGQQIAEARIDAGLTLAELARCAGIDPSFIGKIERGIASPSLDTLVALSACLGADVGVRLFRVIGPRLRDRFQAPMVEALIACVGAPWRARVEVPVPAARGVVDVVLERDLDRLAVVCECHSELRRLELVLRRLHDKTEAVRGLRQPADAASSVLLVRSTVATRSIARAYEATFRAAFPARPADALAALRGDSAWPGSVLLWARVERGKAVILDGPPRGVRLGR